jgi:hypothetical protein
MQNLNVMYSSVDVRRRFEGKALPPSSGSKSKSRKQPAIPECSSRILSIIIAMRTSNPTRKRTCLILKIRTQISAHLQAILSSDFRGFPRSLHTCRDSVPNVTKIAFFRFISNSLFTNYPIIRRYTVLATESFFK